ncbi:MAG TPA: exonuclease domain-containing protein [Chloroflexota bacterium]|nr:exonuclease domain-containing protein [Chloroflexota bacterium]
MQFFVVDLEFSGFVPGYHEILEIGAVALDAEYAVREEWAMRVAAEHPERASDWVRAHQQHLLAGGTPLAEAIPAFVRWVEALRGEDTALYVGWTCGADLEHLETAYRTCDLASPFHYRHVELNSVVVGRLGLPWDYDHSAARRLLGVPGAGSHVALADAREAAAVFQAVMRWPVVRPEGILSAEPEGGASPDATAPATT